MNKKRIISGILAAAMGISILATGCGDQQGGGKFKVGMVTDSGTIDDKSFNQGTWEGAKKAADELKFESKYLKPGGKTEADYLKEIGNLYDAGFKFIVCPGYMFSSAIFKAQDKYSDAKFVIIDAAPNSGEKGAKDVIKPNTVSILFAEHESGFVAGVAAALQLKEGDFGFIGGIEIPAVQKYNWGFQQGVNYANANLGTKITMKPENVVYQGSFDNTAAGQQLAAQMFGRGVKAIFAAAGGVGTGAINEAKTQVKAGKEAWVIGVDVDQFIDGIYEGDAEKYKTDDKEPVKSAVLTSAMKKVDQSSYDMVKAENEDKFPGGQTLVFDSKNNGVGIPAKNPNLSDDVVSKVNDVFKKVQSGEIKIATEQGDLIK